MNWININKQKPKDGQHILAKYKHGVIDCVWIDKHCFARAYVWQFLEFSIHEWIDFDEFKKMMGEG